MSTATVEPRTLPRYAISIALTWSPAELERQRAVQRPLQDLDVVFGELSEQAGRLLAIAFRKGIDRSRALRAHQKCMEELRALRDAHVSDCWEWVHGRSEVLPRSLSCGTAGQAFEHLIEAIHA